MISRIWLLSFVLVLLPGAYAEEVSQMVLFGGSSVRTSYIPEGKQHHQALESMLVEVYPDQKVEVRNWADNGESIARYLLNGAYEAHRSKAKGLDIAIIRFGTNDQKLAKTPEYEKPVEEIHPTSTGRLPGSADHSGNGDLRGLSRTLQL